MKVKLHLEVVKLDIDFLCIWSNLFGVFITKGDLVYLHLFRLSRNLKIDSDISGIKSYIILRLLYVPARSRDCTDLNFQVHTTPGSVLKKPPNTY